MNASKIFNEMYDECYRTIKLRNDMSTSAKANKLRRLISLMRKLNAQYNLNEIVDYEHIMSVFYNSTYKR